MVVSSLIFILLIVLMFMVTDEAARAVYLVGALICIRLDAIIDRIE